LAYAITIHKAQGISVDKAILNLSGDQDFAASLTYVAISRVRSLRGLLFKKPFGYSRLKYKPGDIVIMRNADYVRRQAQEVQMDDVVMPEIEPLSSNYGGDFDMEDLDEEGLDELPDLPGLSAVGPGRATQMSIPILHSEPIHSTVTIPSALAITSDAEGSHNNGEDDDGNRDEEMGGTQGSYD
jgi:hypothetical protein